MRDLARDNRGAPGVAVPLRLPAAAADPVALETRALGFAALGQGLLQDVSLRIRAGRLTAIMGPNGAGKSLLLRLLHGLAAPCSGEILWHGRPLDASARKAQAMVFQRPVLLRRSVRANLKFALAVRGVPRRARAARVAEALEGARLSHLADRPARLLSGGEQQRLAIARALACRPETLLLDEPTASLDPASTLAIEALIRDACRAGVTTVLVTHDAGQARRLADDAVFLHSGRVTEVGPVGQVLDAPRSAAARAWSAGEIFVGAGPSGA